ncbi:MAG: KpsF/GutQ family sugar-phosphate isomerase [Wigglesworthia glossinidia]|nr:KpsF/GutQ family sugar-phosphate isomerase [Wigglesworthia glossinidia]
MLKNSLVSTFDFVKSGKKILALELKNLQQLHQCINHNFQKAGEILLNCSGKIITMGIGKSGYIARKLAATFSSTGNPSFFIHPTEASHGDLGMLSSGDIIVAFSKSGESHEIIVLISFIKHLDIPYICITENPSSTIAKSANVYISIHKTQEACALGAPTTSTTAALIIGDALAISLARAKNFNVKKFSFLHPGGLLGKKLLIRVHEIMRAKNDIPVVDWTCSVFHAIIEIAKKNFGTVVVLNNHKKILGVFTSKILISLSKLDLDFRNTNIKTVMTSTFKIIHPNILASKALEEMKYSNVKFLLVAINSYLLGIIQMRDILNIGLY